MISKLIKEKKLAGFWFLRSPVLFLLFPSYLYGLKCLWSEICFCLVIKFTLSNTHFQSLTHLELKRTILQAVKVEHFASQKWSGEWVELIQNYRAVMSIWCQTSCQRGGLTCLRKMLSDSEMSDISERSSNTEEGETEEEDDEDVEIIYSQLMPYQHEPLAEVDTSDNTWDANDIEEEESDEDRLTAANLEARHKRETPVNLWLINSSFILDFYAVIPGFKHLKSQRPTCLTRSHITQLTNRFHVAVHLFSNRSQMTSKCGKNKKVAHKAIAECVTDVLTTFWRPLWSIYWTDAQQHAIYLFYTIKKTHNFSFLLSLSQLLESWPLPTLANTKKAIWRNLLSMQNEAISLVAMP